MSKIEWTNETWNPTTGCSRVSDGCDHCYAMYMARRLQHNPTGDIAEKYADTTRNKDGVDWTGVVHTHDDRLETPLSWQKPRRVFVGSMSDLFHPSVPFEFLDKVFAVMALAHEHTFQVLTKRPGRMQEYLEQRSPATSAWRTLYKQEKGIEWKGERHNWPLPNVWLGTSCEHQDAANERIPHLLACPAAVRFVSAEPLIGRIDLSRVEDGEIGLINVLDGSTEVWSDPPGEYYRGPTHATLDWVIVGGESGPDARPMHPDWARQIRDDCADHDVPLFFKQWGAWVPSSHVPTAPDTGHYAWPWADGERGNLHGDTTMMVRVGKKKAGRRLDGELYNEFPETTHARSQ